MSWYRLKLSSNKPFNYVDEIKSAVRAKFIRAPYFLPALCEVAPLPIITRLGRIKRIVYPEDQLRKTLFQRKPELLESPHRDDYYNFRWYKHPADIFVSKQMAHMKNGMSKEQAFRKVEWEMEEEKAILSIEVELARRHAETLGIPDRSKAVLHHRILLYKQAAHRWSELEQKQKRERIEQYLEIRKSGGDKDLLTAESIPGINEADMRDFIKVYPEYGHLFAPELRELKASEEENYLEDELEGQIDIQQTANIIEDPKVVLENAIEERVEQENTEDIDNYDRNVNPTRHRDLRLYMKTFLNADPIYWPIRLGKEQKLENNGPFQLTPHHPEMDQVNFFLHNEFTWPFNIPKDNTLRYEAYDELTDEFLQMKEDTMAEIERVTKEGV